MMKKAIFTILFVPAHSALTVVCVVHWLNFNSVVDTGLWPRFVNLCAIVLSLPALLPSMMLLNVPRGKGIVFSKFEAKKVKIF